MTRYEADDPARCTTHKYGPVIDSFPSPSNHQSVSTSQKRAVQILERHRCGKIVSLQQSPHAHAVAPRLFYRRHGIWTLTPVWVEDRYGWLILNKESTLHSLQQKLCFLACAPDRFRAYAQAFIVKEAAEIGTPEEHCE